jgi:hypothetical protein
MADSQSNARPRAAAGPPASGVIHIRTRLTADFTVLSNALAQRPGCAVTVGVAAYIASLPDGTPVSIDALCKHFDQGEILISRALRTLEAAGHLERRRERQPNGNIRTRTYFYDIPGGNPDTDGPPKTPRPRKTTRAAADSPPLPAANTPAPAPPQPKPQPQPQPKPKPEPQPEPQPEPEPQPQPEPEPQPEHPVTPADIDPQVLAVLTSLRRVDPRLVLSTHEAARLAPAITQWLTAGVDRVRIVSLLTERLPDHFLGRPAGILAYRLRQTPLPTPQTPSPQQTPTEKHPPLTHPLRNCDGCDRGFRAPETVERCRDCRSHDPLRTAC